MAKKTSVLSRAKETTKSGSMPILLLLLLVSLLGWFLYNNVNWIGINPFSKYAYDNVSSATKDSDGYTYVIADSGSEILKISGDGKLVMIISGKKAGFAGATHISCGGDKKLYVHTVEYSTGVRISEERIICIDPENGNPVKSLKYIPRDINAMMQDFAGFVPTEDGMLFILKEFSGLCIYDQKNKLVKRFDFESAGQEVITASYDVASDTICYSTYSGCLYTRTGDGEAVKRYDSESVNESIPQDICLYNGVIYMADVGKKNIFCFPLKDFNQYTVEEDCDIEEREIAAVVSAGTGGVTVVSESSVFDVNDDAIVMQEKPVLSDKVALMASIVWIAIILSALIWLYLLVLLIRYLISHSTFGTKLALGIIVGVFAVAALFLGTVFPGFTEQFENEIYSKEQLASKTALEAIGPLNLLELGSPSDADTPEYAYVRETARDIFFSGEINDFYCMIYMKVGDHVRVVYTLEDFYYGYPSEYVPEDLEGFEVGVFRKGKSTSSQGTYLFVQLPFADAEGNVAGFVEVGTDTDDITRKNNLLLRGLVVNILAMIVIVVLFMVELVSFLHAKREDDRLREEGIKPEIVQPELYRFVVFLVFFFTNLTCAILPIYSLKMASNMSLFGISSEILSAIPISAEVFAGAVFSAIGGKIIRKIGNKKAIALSSFLFTAGLALRIVPNLFTLTLGALVLGSGWGIQLLMVNVMIATLPEAEKDKGYSHYNVASLAGANSAIVLGGFLVQWIDYSVLFIINALGSVALYYVSRKYLADVVFDEEKSGAQKDKGKSVLKFIFKPRVIIFFVFMLTPLLIAGYFLYYMFPIIGSEWGISDTYIGYLLVVCGLFSVVFGGKTTEFFSKGKRKSLGLFCAALLYAVGFYVVAKEQNLQSLLAALGLIGIADSFGIPLLSNYYTDLKEVSEFGYDKAFGIYSLFENTAQSLGSFAFGSVLVVGVEKGLKIMLIVLLAMALVFFVSSLSIIKTKGGQKNE